MFGGMMMQTRNRRYPKPNMNALKGEWGKEIIRIIRETPTPDFSKIEKNVKAIKEKMLAEENER